MNRYIYINHLKINIFDNTFFVNLHNSIFSGNGKWAIFASENVNFLKSTWRMATKN